MVMFVFVVVAVWAAGVVFGFWIEALLVGFGFWWISYCVVVVGWWSLCCLLFSGGVLVCLRLFSCYGCLTAGFGCWFAI